MPAEGVVKKFGGAAALAKAIGRSRSRVYRWTRPKERGGTGGTIPQDMFPVILKEAKKRKITLTIEDLIPKAWQK